MLRYLILSVLFQTFNAEEVDKTEYFPCGDEGPIYFNDGHLYDVYGQPSKIRITADAVVNSIQFSYGGHDGPVHGGFGGNVYELRLGEGEIIAEFHARTGTETVDSWDTVVCRIAYVIRRPDGSSYNFGPFGDCYWPDGSCDSQSENGVLYISGSHSTILNQLEHTF